MKHKNGIENCACGSQILLEPILSIRRNVENNRAITCLNDSCGRSMTGNDEAEVILMWNAAMIVLRNKP